MNKLKAISNGIQWVNILAALGHILGALPAGIQGNPYIIAVQTIIAAILPSVNGVGHRIIFGKDQEAVAAAPATEEKL